MIVLELMSNGDLRNHLVKLRTKGSSLVQRDDLSRRLLKFCQDVAAGMSYLADKSFVHRDLAARNILMSHDLTCKISDFAMSRGLEEETYYMSKGGKIPIKWTAPEAIHYKKYSTGSDVWSYGMVMYEIWSLGQKPFSDFTNAQLTQTVSLLERSFCLPPPPGTPHEIYSLMVQCWHPDKSCRPSFPSLSHHLGLPVSQLLHWSTEEVTGVGPQAIMLGAPLKTAHKLHMTLQNTYHTQL
ncbi:Ephrin type-A receptor 4a (Fragment) [Geodia barretti]|uniref:Ephrin type-A receptor 4a n=2 Tax=Geodia barretti TaxID=519541 RepID=A0AA35WT86_GEOBA